MATYKINDDGTVMFAKHGFIIHINGNFAGYYFEYPEKLIVQQYVDFSKQCQQQFDSPIFETLDTIEKDKLYTSDHVDVQTTTTWICKKPDGSWDDLRTIQVSTVKWQDRPLESFV